MLAGILIAGVLHAPEAAPASGAALGGLDGMWAAWLETPGGPLPFGLELKRADGKLRAWLVNGPDRDEIPTVELQGAELTLDIRHYDSKITASLNDDGTIDGIWEKPRGDSIAKLAFHAKRGTPGFEPLPPRKNDAGAIKARKLPPKWRAEFAKTSGPIVGVFESEPDNRVIGTFLTTTGDLGRLVGRYERGELRLSNFDGAHAFLLKATMQEDGSLKGDFWAGDWHHETWTATPDADAALPDAFGLTRSRAAVERASVVFQTLDGMRMSLADPPLAGRPVLLEVFGSWCPNCNDEAKLLSDLNRRYKERGLSVVGLAFERTGALASDKAQVQRYIDRHDITYTILYGGKADKKAIADALPFLQSFQAYPTTLFISPTGRIVAVYTGFSGPATGAAYDQLKADFERTIETLLAERG